MKTMEERTREVMRRSRARIAKRRRIIALCGTLSVLAVLVGVGAMTMPPQTPPLAEDVQYGTNGNATDGGNRNNVGMHEIESERDFSMLGKEYTVVQMKYTADGVSAVLEGDDCKPAWDALIRATEAPPEAPKWAPEADEDASAEAPESAPEADEDASAPIDVTATATAVRAVLTVRFEDGTAQTWLLSDRLLKSQTEGYLIPVSKEAMTELLTVLNSTFN